MSEIINWLRRNDVAERIYMITNIGTALSEIVDNLPNVSRKNRFYEAQMEQFLRETIGGVDEDGPNHYEVALPDNATIEDVKNLAEQYFTRTSSNYVPYRWESAAGEGDFMLVDTDDDVRFILFAPTPFKDPLTSPAKHSTHPLRNLANLIGYTEGLEE
jgi:hypothetical protein